MTSRERVLAALRCEQPDMVPFMNEDTDIEIITGVLGIEQVKVEGSYVEQRNAGLLPLPGGHTKLDFVRKMHMDTIQGPWAMPPFFCKTHKDAKGRDIIVDGDIKTRDDLEKVRFPKIDEEYLLPMHTFVEAHRDTGLALYYRTRMGVASVLNSMGLDGFAFALADDPELPATLLQMYAEWQIELIQKTQGIGVDFLFFCDDIAFNTAPMFSPDVFREIFLPSMRKIADTIKIPWIYHSDGNLMPIWEDLLSLGMNGLNPLEPGAMDIEQIKRDYGKRICLIGNIDLRHTLPFGTVEEVEAEVKDRIEKIGKGGGYILSTANSMVDYCKIENILAMRDAFLKYRKY